ncbi:glycine cleavage system protein H [Nocardia terpenica]|uniref:Glycine cleavage system protein H n=1 Tax=Nocardia terpenica TaxID=455432 RepID=A0A291RJJ1_9NOCA|nr:glycine cleavage system protein H [Nocardia terpenica]ATL67781.1 glycine cleavage system protein H [Nocardia terpenica]
MQVHQLPIDRAYTGKHLWVALAPGERFADSPLRVGLTAAAVPDRAVAALRLPPIRSIVDAGVACGAVRMADGSEFAIHAPIGGLVTIHNAAAIEQPELLAQDPFHAGWLFAVLPAPGSSSDGLLTHTRYLEELRTVTR